MCPCLFGGESERLFVNKKNVGRSYPCTQRTTLPRLRTLFAAKPRAEFDPPYSTSTKKTGMKPVFFVGGESEIRTLEPCYRLHDFQSCALDQLGEFSKNLQLLNKYIISFGKNQVLFLFLFGFILLKSVCIYVKINRKTITDKKQGVKNEKNYIKHFAFVNFPDAYFLWQR